MTDPYRIYSHHNPLANLEVIVATYHGNTAPALGGCRFQEYTSTNDALFDAKRLARGMFLKSSLANLPLSGGKAVILKPKEGTYNRQTLFEALGDFLENLRGQYITALDSGTLVSDMDTIQTRTRYVTCTSQHQEPSNPAAMTALGILNGMKAAAEIHFGKPSLKNRTVAVQGVGAVGYHLSKLCTQAGAKLIVCDLNPERTEKAVSDFHAHETTFEKFWSTPCDILAPCALGAVLNDDTIPAIQAPIVAGGANNQLLDEPVHSTALFQRHITYVPDFAINAGGIIHVAAQYWQSPLEKTIERVNGIYNTCYEILMRAKQEHCTPLQIAEKMAYENLEVA